MPTRIVLQETTRPSRRLTHTNDTNNRNHSDDEEYKIRRQHAEGSPGGTGTGGNAFTTPPRRSTNDASGRHHQHQQNQHQILSGSQRRVVGFRSSILRDLSRPPSSSDQDLMMASDGDADHDNAQGQDLAAQQRRLQLHLSNEDIRASPRLLGYLFGSIAYVVMLVSVVQFYRKEDEAWTQSESSLANYSVGKFPDDTYFHTVNGPIYLWKLWSSIAVASTGSLTFLWLLAMHFDTICFPRTWFQIFRDGSLAERNLLCGLLVFCAAGLHINTSSFSVGESQANVFFTSWIVFVCTALNIGVWRESADLPRLAAKVLSHHRETTYNWCWTLIFNLILAGAATDLFYHRTEIVFRLKGEELVLDFGSWMRILALVWAIVLCCMVAIFFNHVWTTTWKLKISSECRFILNWRFLEGILILTLMGINFWIILTYTGVDGVINGLNNAYFGIWGSFFNIVFTFGTWLRENRDIDYII